MMLLRPSQRTGFRLAARAWPGIEWCVGRLRVLSVPVELYYRPNVLQQAGLRWPSALSPVSAEGASGPTQIRHPEKPASSWFECLRSRLFAWESFSFDRGSAGELVVRETCTARRCRFPGLTLKGRQVSAKQNAGGESGQRWRGCDRRGPRDVPALAGGSEPREVNRLPVRLGQKAFCGLPQHFSLNVRSIKFPEIVVVDRHEHCGKGGEDHNQG